MKLSYDKETDSLYIHLSNTPSVDSDEVADGVVLDFDSNGVLVGIDMQQASQKADIQSVSLSHLPLNDLYAADALLCNTNVNSVLCSSVDSTS
jgi:uncharacterized protein YuzE